MQGVDKSLTVIEAFVTVGDSEVRPAEIVEANLFDTQNFTRLETNKYS